MKNLREKKRAAESLDDDKKAKEVESKMDDIFIKIFKAFVDKCRAYKNLKKS